MERQQCPAAGTLVAASRMRIDPRLIAVLVSVATLMEVLDTANANAALSCISGGHRPDVVAAGVAGAVWYLQVRNYESTDSFRVISRPAKGRFQSAARRKCDRNCVEVVQRIPVKAAERPSVFQTTSPSVDCFQGGIDVRPGIEPTITRPSSLTAINGR